MCAFRLGDTCAAAMAPASLPAPRTLSTAPPANSTTPCFAVILMLQLTRQLEAIITDPALGGPPTMFPQFVEVGCHCCGRFLHAGQLAAEHIQHKAGSILWSWPVIKAMVTNTPCFLYTACRFGPRLRSTRSCPLRLTFPAIGPQPARNRPAARLIFCCPQNCLQIWTKIALDPQLPAQERSAVPFVLLLQVREGGGSCVFVSEACLCCFCGRLELEGSGGSGGSRGRHGSRRWFCALCCACWSICGSTAMLRELPFHLGSWCSTWARSSGSSSATA